MRDLIALRVSLEQLPGLPACWKSMRDRFARAG